MLYNFNFTALNSGPSLFYFAAPSILNNLSPSFFPLSFHVLYFSFKAHLSRQGIQTMFKLLWQLVIYGYPLLWYGFLLPDTTITTNTNV